MPEKDPDNFRIIASALWSLISILIGFLMYRVWDVQKSLARQDKKLALKADKDSLTKSVTEIKNENKEDFRYYNEKVTDSVNGLAESLRNQIRDSLKDVYDLIEKIRK
jgi:gamma-glutamyl phosphate reductase